jgi:hypothetical protein
MGEQTRRSFLKSIAGATAAASALVVDPEFLLWKPGAKKIFLPAPQIERPNLSQLGTMLLETPYVRMTNIRGEHLRNMRSAKDSIYMPDRFRVTAGGESIVFDSDWKAVRGSAHGRQMTRQELESSARRILRSY